MNVPIRSDAFVKGRRSVTTVRPAKAGIRAPSRREPGTGEAPDSGACPGHRSGARRGDDSSQRRLGCRDRQWEKNGFTLLELIIVLALMTLILGLSSVFFAGLLPSARAGAAGREISGLIRHTRSLARMNMESRSVVIDMDNRTYGVEGLAPKSFPPDARVTVVDPFAGEIAGGTYRIVFGSAGGMSGGTIILSWGKKVIRIELDPIVGAVLLKDG